MGLINDFTNKIVFLDTTPLIYFIEANKKYEHILDKLFLLNEQGKFQFITSVITLQEVLVLPFRENAHKLVNDYEKILCNTPSINIYEINIEIAKSSAKIRAEYGFRTPDSLQLATAIFYSADFFLTNDKRLKSVKEIRVLSLDDIF